MVMAITCNPAWLADRDEPTLRDDGDADEDEED